jgi:hypothetical protein
MKARIVTNKTRRKALTLLEMMVAVTLLAMIMIGLLAMFNQTQKALRAVNAQSDIFENARGALSMLSRDLSEMTAYGESDVVNFTFGQSALSGNVNVTVPGGTIVPFRFHEAFWLARANDQWSGVGYFVDSQADGVGTLYRFSIAAREKQVPLFYPAYVDSSPAGQSRSNLHRVSDGVVSFQLSAVYPNVANGTTNFVSSSAFQFYTNALPAFVDVEIGVLEPATLLQMQSLLSTPNIRAGAVEEFLTNHVGNIHFFRQRVPVRNFNNPYRLNEVP